MTKTGRPNYLVARVPVPSKLNISKWRELLQGYDDNVVCDFLEFSWPVGFMPTTLPVLTFGLIAVQFYFRSKLPLI